MGETQHSAKDRIWERNQQRTVQDGAVTAGFFGSSCGGWFILLISIVYSWPQQSVV
jgi:hypothetical protein